METIRVSITDDQYQRLFRMRDRYFPGAGLAEAGGKIIGRWLDSQPPDLTRSDNVYGDPPWKYSTFVPKSPPVSPEDDGFYHVVTHRVPRNRTMTHQFVTSCRTKDDGDECRLISEKTIFVDDLLAAHSETVELFAKRTNHSADSF